MAGLQSSQTFIRALKGSNDPPTAGGPSKIDLAEQSWQDHSFRLPNKAEVIVDWILTRFFKEKAGDGKAQAITNPRYWKLLADIISSQELKTFSWLKALLGRVSLVSITTTFLTAYEGGDVALVEAATASLSKLWPLGTQKSTTEALLTCWTTFLTKARVDSALLSLGILVTESYHQSLNNSSARKKIHTTFLQSLKAWIEQASVPQVLLAGMDTLFNLDILRQMHDSKSAELPLFQALMSLEKENRPLVLEFLPTLLKYHIVALRKNKGAILNTGSNDFNSAAMQFFGFCQSILDVRTRDADTWKVACNLLEIVEKEHLYHSSNEDEAALALLTKNLDLGLEGLSSCWHDGEAEVTDAIVKCLSVLIEIDCDLILPVVPRILSSMLYIPAARPSHFTFLSLVLDYHIKTRTLNDYIDVIFSCMRRSTVLVLGPQERYQLASSSPILHPSHLGKIAKAVHQFLTPGQCHKTVESTFDGLKAIQGQYKSAQKSAELSRGDGSRKKRKSDAPPPAEGVAEEPSDVAITYSLSARLAQIVVSSVPLQTLPKDAQTTLKTMVSEFVTDFVQHQSSKLVKSLAKQSSADEQKKEKKRKHRADELDWADQVILASILRIEYALERAKPLEVPSTPNEKLTKRMIEILALKRGEVLPELALEISRSLLLHAPSTESTEFNEILDPILDCIESEVPTGSHEETWNGQPHSLPRGKAARAHVSLAILHLLLERWLSTIDKQASSQQLARLIKIIAQLPLDRADASNDDGGLTPQHLLLRTLRSAQFWELQGVRDAFLAYLIEATNGIAECASERPIKSTYHLLLFFPVEYFTKNARAELVKRALKSDQQMHPFTSPAKLEASAILRLFLERTFSFTGSVDQQTPPELANFLLHLLRSPQNADEIYINTTLELASLYFLELFRLCSKSNTGEIVKVLSSYSQYKLYSESQAIRAKSLAKLVDLVTKEMSLTNFSEENQAAFENLHSHLVAHLQEKMTRVLKNTKQNLSDVPLVLTGWCATLSLGRWLGTRDTSQFYGPQLAAKFNSKFLSSLRQTSPSLADELAVLNQAIILQELHYSDPMEQNAQLDLAVATCLSSLQAISADGRSRVYDQIGRTSRLLSPDSYAHVLELVEETLAQPRVPHEMLVDLIHLALVLLREHPQNTLKITQNFVTSCISAFNGSAVFVNGPKELRLQVLALLSQHCSERPAALRLLDMSGLWLLLSKFLSPSEKHDSETSTEIFHKIVAIANAVIRLRRDLVVPMLPHLGMVLRQLLSIMRSGRPQLGSKQTELVLRAQPQWISASQALGAEEAKALARLLETLTTKTVPRTHGAIVENQKAESIASAFSKHAAYVLKAYIDVVNEPLCVLSVDVRKELAPGLYSLCVMINEHSRDALMAASLDNNGRATMKALWKEYEKQRYVGKG